LEGGGGVNGAGCLGLPTSDVSPVR